MAAITAGRSYGYRPIPGKPGELEIDEAEAATVRQIFADYLGARSPRDIAAALNKEAVPGPRGGVWNASTIGGSRKRLNGILQNELYAGRIVWNRQTFIKDPETGKRISRENPREQWMTADAEHLRIVDAETWAKVRARREDRGGANRTHATRPKNLLSGLIKCGCCGSGYVVGGNDKRGSILVCTRMKETGLCENRRTVPRAAVEALVLKRIEENLAAPELIAEYVREYHRVSRELHSSTAHRHRDLEKRLGNINGAIAKAVDVLLAETPSRALRDRLAALEAERDEIEAEIAAVAPPAVEFHPNAANAYGDKVRNLKRALAESDEDSRAAANEAIREIVEKVVIHPRGPYKPVEIEIYGQLAALLRISERAAADPLESRGVLVAGTRNTRFLRLVENVIPGLAAYNRCPPKADPGHVREFPSSLGERIAAVLQLLCPEAHLSFQTERHRGAQVRITTFRSCPLGHHSRSALAADRASAFAASTCEACSARRW